MPGSANFIGEFYILNGLFDEKTALAVVASAGIRDGGVLRPAPVPARNAQLPPPSIFLRELGGATRWSWSRSSAILILAFTPGTILTRGEASVQDEVGAVAALDDGHLTAGELKS